MRNFWIYGILILGFPGMGFGRETAKPTVSATSSQPESAPWNGILHTDGSGTPWSAGHSDREPDQVCYKMRSYLVRRESAGSDAVEGVGYRTCLPGSRVEMRTAELPAIPEVR